MTSAVRRARSIHSGRLEYRFEVGIVRPNAAPPRLSAWKVFSFAGSDWIERDRKSTSMTIHRGGDTLVYRETHEQDGSLRRTAVLSQAGSVPERSENRRPVFAGSFWDDQQLEYVDRHRGRFRLATSAKVADIDCELCEVDVPPDEISRVAQLVHPQLKAGGILRVCVSQELGFAVPRVEICSHDGAEVVAYESTGWLELAGDVFFPRRIRKEIRALDGSIVYEQFEIVPELINQAIDEAEFVVEIPAGTHVRDERNAVQVRYELTSPSTSTRLIGEEPSSAAERNESFRRRVSIVAGVLLVALVCGLLGIRYLRVRR